MTDSLSCSNLRTGKTKSTRFKLSRRSPQTIFLSTLSAKPCMFQFHSVFILKDAALKNQSLPQISNLELFFSFLIWFFGLFDGFFSDLYGFYWNY